MPAMTAHKASNAGWLMFTARARFKLISGGADPDHDVRQAVRERLADGRLFPVDGVSVARRGSGQLCVVCGRVINPSQEERVVEGGRGDARAVTHAPCYCLWREESRRPNM